MILAYWALACLPQEVVPTTAPVVEPGELPPQWVDLTAWPCAVDDLGDVHCWTSSGDLRPGFTPPPTTLHGFGGVLPVSVPDGSLFALDQGEFRSLHCAWGGGSEGCFDPGLDGTSYQALAALSMVALRSDQHLDYRGWNENNPDPEDRYLLLDSAFAAAFDTRFQLRIASLFWEGVGDEHILPVHLTGSPVAMTAWAAFEDADEVWEAGGCVLDDGQSITCAGGFLDYPFSGGGWSALDGWGFTACAARVAGGVLCHDGFRHVSWELDWGPIRSLAVQSRPAEWDPPSVCAITERNELKCDGPRFDEAFQAELEAMNDLRRNPG